MLNTSTDLMYVILSLCIVIFTGFLGWIMYYIAQILKQGNEVIADIRQKITEFEEILDSIRSKVMTSASSITFIAGEVTKIVRFIKKRKDEAEEDEE